MCTGCKDEVRQAGLNGDISSVDAGEIMVVPH